MNGNTRIVLWGAAAFLFLLPLVAMQFTDEVDWTVFDFAVFGGLLFAACGAYEITVCVTGRKLYRLITAAIIVVVFLLFWVQGAAGIF